MDPRTLRNFPNADLHQRQRKLERSVGDLAQEIAALDRQRQLLNAEMSRQTTHLNTIKNEFERRTRPAVEPTISDHALLRYVERVIGIDTEACRTQILNDNVVAAIRSGATTITVNGVKFVVQGARIVTTLGENQRVKRKDQRNGKTVDVNDRAAVNEGLADYYEDQSAP